MAVAIRPPPIATAGGGCGAAAPGGAGAGASASAGAGAGGSNWRRSAEQVAEDDKHKWVTRLPSLPSRFARSGYPAALARQDWVAVDALDDERDDEEIEALFKNVEDGGGDGGGQGRKGEGEGEVKPKAKPKPRSRRHMGSTGSDPVA